MEVGWRRPPAPPQTPHRRQWWAGRRWSGGGAGPAPATAAAPAAASAPTAQQRNPLGLCQPIGMQEKRQREGGYTE